MSFPTFTFYAFAAILIFAALRVLYDTVSAWKYLTAVAPCRDICKAAQVDATRRR